MGRRDNLSGAARITLDEKGASVSLRFLHGIEYTNADVSELISGGCMDWERWSGVQGHLQLVGRWELSAVFRETRLRRSPLRVYNWV